MQGLWLIIGALAVLALVLLTRGPMREWSGRRTQKRQERKREWRRDRDAAKAQHRAEHAMNPERAAARKPPPTWQKVAKAQGSKCWLCGTRTYSDDRGRDSFGREVLGATFPVVDYVESVDKGGSQTLDNARIAHRHCAQVRAANPARGKYGSPPRTYAPSA